MNQLVAQLILMMMLEFLASNWVSLRLLEMRTGVSLVCSTKTVRDENWHKFSLFHTYITHEGKNYKLMIDVGSCANIITKTALEKMGLKAEPHPHPYNVNWVDKTAQSIT